ANRLAVEAPAGRRLSDRNVPDLYSRTSSSVETDRAGRLMLLAESSRAADYENHPEMKSQGMSEPGWVAGRLSDAPTSHETVDPASQAADGQTREPHVAAAAER